MKVLIPVLHCIFTAAQLWGEKCTWDLWQQEKRKAKRSLEEGTTRGGNKLGGNEIKTAKLQETEVAVNSSS